MKERRLSVPSCALYSGVPATSIRALLAGLVDYAGLFPPASLDMESAVREYATHRTSDERWMLGAFIVPAARLAEFEAAAAAHLPRDAAGAWRLSVLPSPDLGDSIRLIGEFNCRHAAAGASRASIDTIEFKAGSADELTHALSLVPAWLTAYVELPLGDALPALLDVVARHGARAKVRTGGVTADAFPEAAVLARFIVACRARGVPFKATAGLHHPLRGEYRLTYEPGSAAGTMFGFLNVFLAAAFASLGLAEHDVAALLDERNPGAFTISDSHITWRDHTIAPDAVARVRDRVAMGFGACSFREPTDELHGLGWL
jgi:hypothetical protein